MPHDQRKASVEPTVYGRAIIARVEHNKHGLSRRSFLATTVAAAIAACSADPELSSDTGAAAPATPIPDAPTPTGTPVATPTSRPEPTERPTDPPLTVELAANPFTLGIASGDPTPNAVILWTRLALPGPTPIPDSRLDVRWEVGRDESFDEVVATGLTPAVPGLAHSVHADATGLEPDSSYTYRFIVGDFSSPTGRTRTLPDLASSPTSLRFGFSSCQHWETGLYAAHRHLAEENLDLFVWLGDYIYESGPTSTPMETSEGPRVHDGPTISDLDGYRSRYALYKSDRDLQRHHAATPWLITWDDHEVANDYAASTSQDNRPEDEFLALRAAAYQAWYEHMPVRLDAPTGPDYEIHRQFVWGDLAEIFVLDGRQFRDDQPTDGASVTVPGFEDQDLPLRELGPTALDPEQRFLGLDQERWFTTGMSESTRAWKLVAQQVMMHGLTVPLGDGPVTITDSWDGYFANRRDILDTLHSAGVDNMVVLTGDLHTASVGDLRPDPYDLAGPVVGTELMATSISSAFPASAGDLTSLISLFNPQIKHFDARNGYTVCDLTASSCKAAYRVVDDVTSEDANVFTAATFVIDSGVPGARRQ